MESSGNISTDTQDSDILDAFANTSAEVTLDPDSEPEAEVTLKNLRGKKIKTVPVDSNFIENVKRRVAVIVQKLKDENRQNELKTARELICIKLITKSLPNDYVEKLSINQMRRVVAEVLKEDSDFFKCIA